MISRQLSISRLTNLSTRKPLLTTIGPTQNSNFNISIIIVATQTREANSFHTAYEYQLIPVMSKQHNHQLVLEDEHSFRIQCHWITQLIFMQIRILAARPALKLFKWMCRRRLTEHKCYQPQLILTLAEKCSKQWTAIMSCWIKINVNNLTCAPQFFMQWIFLAHQSFFTSREIQMTGTKNV